MQESKFYRVVCSQVRHTDQVFIDIAPTDANRFGVTHEMLFYSRMRISGEDLCDYGTGSVFLTERDNQNPEVDFSQGFHAPKGTVEYDSYMRMCECLKPQILQTFRQMREEGKTTTLNYIMSVPELELFKEKLKAQKSLNSGVLSDEDAFSLREKRKRAQFAEKHRDLLMPSVNATDSAQSLGEEVMIEQRKNFVARERRRQNMLDDMANLRNDPVDVIEIMRQKMQRYDGD